MLYHGIHGDWVGLNCCWLRWNVMRTCCQVAVGVMLRCDEPVVHVSWMVHMLLDDRVGGECVVGARMILHICLARMHLERGICCL